MAHHLYMFCDANGLVWTAFALDEATVTPMLARTSVTASCTSIKTLAHNEDHTLRCRSKAHPISISGMVRTDCVGRVRVCARMSYSFAFALFIIGLTYRFEAHKYAMSVMGNAVCSSVKRWCGCA